MSARAGTLALVLSGCLFAEVTADRILHADKEPQNWLTYSGGYASQRYSELSQVSHDNVAGLQLKWVFAPRSLSKIENTPIVVDGVLYTGTVNEIAAMDAV